MSHQFTSGVFLNATPAWHGLGTVLDGTLPPREAFCQADADFTVAGRPVLTSSGTPIDGYQAITRLDTGDVLSVMRDSYTPVQNEALIRIAEALHADLIMDAVCVLDSGRKVTFTAQIRNTEADITRGDTVVQNLVGVTSHDGSVAFQVMFTPVRVVCANTLAQALGHHSARRTIRHTKGATALAARLPELVDIKRREFLGSLDELRALAATPCTTAQFHDYLRTVFADQLTGTTNEKRGDSSTSRPKVVTDLPYYESLRHKFDGAAIGSDLPGVRGTYWGALNAITEYVSHEAGRSKDPTEAARQRLESMWFGSNARLLDRAHTTALAAL